MIQPKPTSVAQKGDIVAEINFNYSDTGLKSLSDGTRANLIYEVQPSEQDVVDFYFGALDIDLSLIEYSINFRKHIPRPRFHTGTTQ